jgi:CIC family chloride channel protein
MMRALGQNGQEETTVLQAGSRNLIVAFPDEPLREAVVRMLKYDIGRLPVVSRDDPSELVSYLGRSGVMEAQLRRFREENVREPGSVMRGTFPQPKNTRGP